MGTEADAAAMAAWMERQYERSPESVAAEARALVRDPQQGPLEGPYGPGSGGGAVRTASGREPGEAAGPVGSPGSIRRGAGGGGRLAGSGSSDGSGPTAEQRGTRVEMTPELLAAAIEEVRRREASADQQQTQGPPPGYQPPTDETRRFQPSPTFQEAIERAAPAGLAEAWKAAHTLIRLLEQAPDLVREAFPGRTSPVVGRARSMTIQQLDGARLWLREALERAEEERQNQPEE